MGKHTIFFSSDKGNSRKLQNHSTNWNKSHPEIDDHLNYDFRDFFPVFFFFFYLFIYHYFFVLFSCSVVLSSNLF